MLSSRLPLPDLRRQLVAATRGEGPVVAYSERHDGYLYYVFVPEFESRHEFVAPGTFTVRRRERDGAFDQIRIYFQRDRGSYVRIQPNGRTAVLDLWVVGEQMMRSVALPVGFEQLLSISFAELMATTATRIDWGLLAPDRDHPGYQQVETMAAAVRAALPTLGDADDGAMDELGRIVLIETLAVQEQNPGFNCSGFAKWVVDGLVRGRTGAILPIEPIKERHLEYRGTRWSRSFELQRDPYFGLDWTRNLARHAAALRSGNSPGAYHPEQFDVRTVPIAAYIEDVGYRVEHLQRVLYYLAVREPGVFYLGSVNNEFGSAPTMRQHTHVVVFFPYFDAYGRFRVVVMERNVETSLESLARRYAGEFVHLVRVEADSRFDLPPFATGAMPTVPAVSVR